MATPGVNWLPMIRLAMTCLLAVAALALAGEARAGLSRDAMATGEAVPAATPLQAQDTPDATATPANEPSTTSSPKPNAARAGARPGGTQAPDWRALIPGSLR